MSMHTGTHVTVSWYTQKCIYTHVYTLFFLVFFFSLSLSLSTFLQWVYKVPDGLRIKGPWLLNEPRRVPDFRSYPHVRCLSHQRFSRFGNACMYTCIHV